MKIPGLSLALSCLVVTSCNKSEKQPIDKSGVTTKSNRPDPRAVVLAPHEGDGRIDEQIRQVQDQIRSGQAASRTVEQLGWLYVAKARETFDAGYYKLAEQCALCREQDNPGAPECLFLRGHVLHNLHQFRKAEMLANELVAKRGMPVDFGLLGDSLMEQGKLEAAVTAYQRMADLKPDLHVFVRAAHVRWLKGDLAGALELAESAARSISLRDADTAAWVLTRLAFYEFQAGAVDAARVACDQALTFRPDYPPMLLLRGRMLLAETNAGEAVPILRRAAKLVPLPEYEWALAEALEMSGERSEALSVESELCLTGAATDPRTLALFLATRGQDSQQALRLAQEELENRGDVFTQDALAWALAGAGRIDEARTHSAQALVEGTQDARLFFHAAILASRAGDDLEAAKWIAKASGLKAMLLPSERQQLLRLSTTQFPTQSSGLAGMEK